MPRGSEYPWKEIRGLPRGEKITSRTYYLRYEKKSIEGQNTSRFICIPRGLKNLGIGKMPGRLPTLVEYDVYDVFDLFSIIFY